MLRRLEKSNIIQNLRNFSKFYLSLYLISNFKTVKLPNLAPFVANEFARVWREILNIYTHTNTCAAKLGSRHAKCKYCYC